MHTAGARALQLVAAAPKHYGRRIASQRPALGAVRGFLSSPARSARPDESNTIRDDDLRPDNAVYSSEGTTDSNNVQGPETASTASSITTSSNSTPLSHTPTTPTTAAAPKESVAGTGGRSRPSRGRNQDGMPAVVLPDWFLKENVRLHNEDRPAPEFQATLNADLTSASSLIYARSSFRNPTTSTVSPICPQPTEPVEWSSLTWAIRDQIGTYFEAVLDGAVWDDGKVSQAAAELRNGQVDAVARRGAVVIAAASYLTAALACSWPRVSSVESLMETPAGSSKDSHSDALKESSPGDDLFTKLDPDNALRMPQIPFSEASRNYLDYTVAMTSREFIKTEANIAVARGVPIKTRYSERLVFRELQSTLAAELRAAVPVKTVRDLRRPVTVLAISNYKGRTKAVGVVDELAQVLSAHTIHIDARSIAEIAGPYLGQTAFWSRGSIAMLGYTVAQKNGMAASRYPDNSKDRDDEDDDEGDISVTLSRMPSALMRSGLMGRSSLRGFGSESDDRWDDLKINHILEAMVRAADKAAIPTLSSLPTASESRPLIVHLHHFLELSLTIEGNQIVNKLRSIVDRLWQKGRKVVLVGSTSADMGNNTSLMDKAEDMRQEDCHIVPFQVERMREQADVSEAQDTFNENMDNIRSMLSALIGRPLARDEMPWKTQDDHSLEALPKELRYAFCPSVYDIHWVYRFATLVLGIASGNQTSASPSRTDSGNSATKYAYPSFPVASSSSSLSFSDPSSFNLDENSFLHALHDINDQNAMWQQASGAYKPYFSPLTTKVGILDDAEDRHQWDHTAEHNKTRSDPSTARASGSSASSSGKKPAYNPDDFNEYENKFLSDIIDPDDITTTFDNIVLPEETKASLKSLTSLSLIRPEAFLYGVLAAERIPGCLLYGPPGTGKTLLAKAVAKQSGAKMLEISAATINDMWIGNSEKNVRAVFSLARKLAPVVVFLDEADALLAARHDRPGRNGHRETLNQFLREWDGLSSNMKAFIMVATNRPSDLDEAVLRRLPRRILVDLPLRDARLSILRVMLRDELLDDATVSLDRLATETELYSGSDLKNLCVATAMQAVREEVRAQEAHTGVEPYVFPERRVLMGRHFEQAMREIGASISEDMSSLQAIRKFDERYGDNSSKRRNKRRRGMGFEVVPDSVQTEKALVRQAV